VIVGGNDGVLEHKGEERKGMTTWPEGHQGWRSSEGGEMVAAAIILGEAATLRLAGVDRR
jgi:hypothetical protein